MSLLLKTVSADMTSYGGFVWPDSGPVEALDWDPDPRCGGGLHGLLGGVGDGDLLIWSNDAKWLVVATDCEPVDLHGKVKIQRGEVVHCGDRHSATEYLKAHGCTGAICMGTATAGYMGTATAGDRGTATAGYRGTATAGDRGTATAGYRGTATAGDRGTATAGDSGTATAGYMGTATAGDSGTATAGDRGTATAGDSGTATAWDSGTATAGDSGTATAGYMGTATAGYMGTATAGDMGVIIIGRYDPHIDCVVPVVGVIGQGGLQPGTAYRLDDSGAFVEVVE